MKTRIALLGCLVLAWNVASAHVNCAKAPYGESIVQFGRDEFRLGMIAAAHNDDRPSVPQAMRRALERAMRAACRAKFHGRNLARYSKLGLSPRSLQTRSVGSIAAVTVRWSSPYHRRSDRIAPVSSVSARSPPAGRRSPSGGVPHARSPADNHSVAVTSSFPACPRRVDIQTLLSAALIDKSDWPQAEANGRRHGCIVLDAGERVYPLRRETWTGLIQVRPKGHTRTYWTDTAAVR
jgi:hypothetical protein